MTQAQALIILKTGANVFLTGEPGSGKTYVINTYVEYLRNNGIEPSITASTGIAATHIGGMTIHSWSGIGIKKTLHKYDLDKIATTEYITKRIRRTNVLIIDEISMLPPETLTMVDAVCREVKNIDKPFGGIQTVFVGDFFQLPPIIKNDIQKSTQASFIKTATANFACDAPVWKEMHQIVCYLTEQYRQDDADFLSVLSAIRGDVFGDEHFKYLEARKADYDSIPNYVPKLFSHNFDVDRVNEEMLYKLPGISQTFSMASKGPDALLASIKKGCLSPENLKLKIGASVMFTKNSQKDGWVNGTLGTIVEFDQSSGKPIVRIKNGKKITVEPMEWAMEENGKIKARISQIPLRLAWAITVHKSQGMSLDEAVIDLSEVFEYGQGYVALSRVRRLSGIHLLGWNKRAFQVHPEIVEKDKLFRQSSEEAEDVFSKIPHEDLEKLHKNFITANGGKPGTRKSKNQKEEMDTYGKTLILWNEGKNILAIAKERKITESTVFSHLEHLIENRKISLEGISRIISPALARSLPKIFKAFNELNTDKLAPVFEKLKGEYSYNELRLARMALKAK